jgi:hypothetical protein
MKRDSAFRAAARLLFTLGFILALAGTAWANGEEFFAPANNGTVDLVYYGRIKDSQTGRSITDSVYFVLTDKATGLSFPFVNDKPGHFRSPDIGAGIKEIGERVDVKGFEVTVNVGGYKRATITRMPRKGEGTVELDVRLEPIVSGKVSAAGLNDAPPYSRTWIILIGSLALLLVARRLRTSNRISL